MFREMRRFKQQITPEECIELLKKEPRGVLAVHGDDGYPYAMPLDFYYDEETGCIYFHGAHEGHKIDAIRRDPKVSFCVCEQGIRLEGDWAYTARSVVVFGRIQPVTDFERIVEISRKLGLKYYPSAEEVEMEIDKAVKRVNVLELTIDHMTGKRVHEQ